MQRLVAALAAVLALAGPAAAYPGVVEKQTLALADFAFQDGRHLPLSLGYETYGRPDAARDNAILVCHYFSGTSHAAGRYAETDARPGYWDGLIGPGLAIDTRRFWVVSLDVPANVNLGDPHMRSTGPESLDPATHRPYGSRFPALTIRDMVETQKRLMAHLGVKRWHAVMGPSLGGMQALQWAVSYPELVERVAAFGAPGRSDDYNQTLCQVMIEAIAHDPLWHGGDYDPGHPPAAGLATAWKVLYANTGSRDAALDSKPDAPEAWEGWQVVGASADRRVPKLDAGAWMAISHAAREYDLAKGYGSYHQALARIRAKLLIVAARGDLLFPPEVVQEDLVTPLERAGQHPSFQVLDTPDGHLGVVTGLAPLAPQIRAFLN